MASSVLDASALLALIKGEAGSDAVLEIAADAAISSVNLAEVVAKLIEHGLDAVDAVAIIGETLVAVVPFDLVAGIETES